MNEKILKYLYDIKLSIEEIDSYFEVEKREFKNYQSNILLKRSIERNLEIIGEATNRILKVDSQFELTNSRQIIGLRNQLIHSYDAITDETIWGIVINHLPNLKNEIEEKIKNINQ